MSLPFEVAGMIKGVGSGLSVAELIGQLAGGLVVLQRGIERDQAFVRSQRIATLAGLHKALGRFLIEFLRFFLIVLLDELGVAKALTDGRLAHPAELLISHDGFGLVADSGQIVEKA